MERVIGLIGFGEAGRTFAVAGNWREARVYDRLTDDADSRDRKRAEYAAAGIAGCDSLAEAIRRTGIVVSLVTADQALAVAREAASVIAPGALYCDLNSVAPETKRAAAQSIAAAGGDYVDVAVMSPVDPAGLAVPLLVSGPLARIAAAELATMGFTTIEIVGDAIGRASSIKMIRSVMVKGIEALTAECLLAAHAAGVSSEVLASLDASARPGPWAGRADYNLDRMMVHGLRRAAEMEEVATTLEALGTGSMMSRGVIERQRAIGRLGLKRPMQGLTAKIDQINDCRTKEGRVEAA